MLEQLLEKGFEKLNIGIDGKAIERYRVFCDRLEETNKVMNLTAITGEEDIARLHFLDCAAILNTEDFKGKTVIDVGTGAGFPGLALKIAEPDMNLVLLDSLDKRIGFLRDTCRALELDGVECVHARAEEQPEGFREHFEIAVSRAVARLNVLCEMCLPYVKKGGCFIAMKGPDFDEELNEAKHAIAELGAAVEKTVRYTVPGTDIVHSAIVIRKTGPTPNKYPRRWAQIKKQPL